LNPLHPRRTRRPPGQRGYVPPRPLPTRKSPPLRQPSRRGRHSPQRRPTWDAS